MINPRREVRKRLGAKLNIPHPWPGTLGNGDGETVIDSDLENHVWVRTHDGLISVFNNRVPAIYGLRVQVGIDPNQPRDTQVLGTYTTTPAGEGGGSAANYPPASTYEFGGADPLWVSKRQYLPRRIGPGGGMLVQVQPDVFWDGSAWKVLAGQTVDCTSYIPVTAGAAKLLLFTVSDALAVVVTAGAEFTLASMTTDNLMLANTPAVPAGTLAVLGVVRVYRSQTAVQEALTNTDFADYRWSGWEEAQSGTGTIGDHDHSGDSGDGGAFPLTNLLSTGAANGKTPTANGSGGITWETPTAAAGGVVAGTPAAPGETLTLIASTITITDDAYNNGLPGLTDLANGTLMVVYRKGTSHSTDKGSIKVKTSTDDGATWGAEGNIYTDATYDSRDPCIARLDSGRLLVSFKKYDHSGGAYLVDGVFFTYSDNAGASWSALVQINSSFTGWAGPSAPPVELANGTVLQPFFGINTGNTYQSSHVMASTDEGATWGSEAVIGNGQTDSRHYQEPNIVLLQDGRLLALMRSDTPDPVNGNIYQSYSSDSGATWSNPALAFAGSGAPRLIQLKNGMVLCVYRRRSDYVGVYRISRDSGYSWEAETVLDASSAEITYAGIVEYKEGQVGIAYGQEDALDDSEADLLFRRMYTTIEAGQIKSNVPTGTAPLVVASTTLVTNLNADLLDGNEASAFAASDHTHAGGSLTVKEADGTPEVTGVSTIVVTNGTLTDNTGGQVTLDFGAAATDGAAIHDNVAGEIAAITEKATPVAADLLLIEDSADANAKKRVQIGNLPGGAGAIYPQNVSIMFDEFKVVAGGGSISRTISTSNVYNHYGMISTQANGDAAEASFVAKAGVYDFYAIGITSTNRGKIDWSLDGGAAFISGQDWYAGSAANNVVKSGTLTIAADGRHLLRLTVNGKNASAVSPFYIVSLIKVWLVAQTLTSET